MNVLRKSASTETNRRVGLSRRAIRVTVTFLSAITLWVSCHPANLNAAENTSGRIRRAFVPADKPEVWPDGQWKAVPIDQFRLMLKDLSVDEPTPPQALLKRVSYSATWSEASFIKGQLTAEAGLRGFETKYLSLGQPTLSLTDLSWEDRPAVCGTNLDGHSLLRIESDGSQLSGRWSLRGREVLGDIEFNAVLPPSVISRFELRLPSAKNLRVNTGLVAVALADSVPGWRRWVLDLGNESRLHFVITDEPQETASPQLVAQRTSRYRLLPDGLRFRTNFVINNVGGSVDELIFAVPPEMPVSSAVLGNDVDLPFRIVTEEGGSRVVVPLKSITLNSRASITLQGTMPLSPDKRWTLPRISLLQAHLLESRMSINVHRPLEISEFSLTDCRLISSMMNRNQTDSLELEDWSDMSELSISLDTPQVEVVSDVLTTISGDLSQSTMRTLLMLTTRTGSVYKLPCLVPPGWKVTRATSVPWRRPNIVAQWSTTSTDNNGSLLDLEFRDALTPEQTVIVEVWARRVADPMSTSIAMPILRPADSIPRSIAIAFGPVSGQRVSLPESSPYQERTLAEATAVWANDLEGTQWLVDSDALAGQPTILFADAPTDSDRLLVSPGPETDTSMTIDGGTLTPALVANTPTSTRGPIANEKSSNSGGKIMANVTVETTVPKAEGQQCVHIVHYALPVSAAGTELNFQLSEPATFIAARCSGENEITRLSNHEAQIRLPITGDHFDVELEYRTPFSQSMLSGTATILLPQTDVVTTDLCWRLLMPPTFRLDPMTTGTSFEQSAVTWTQRLIGPLGRVATRATGWPSHRNDQREILISESTVTDTQSATAPRNRSLAVAAREHTRTVPFSARILRLEIWKEDVSLRVGWLLIVASCMTIGFIRRLNPPHCALIISLCTVTAGLLTVLVPDSIAIPCGGLFLGVLSGVLLPQRLWSRSWVGENTPTGSTRRAPVLMGTATSLVIVAGGLASVGYAQKERPITPTSPETDVAANAQGDASQFDVLIPITSQQPTLDETPVAYVSPEILERWQLFRQSQSMSPAYLLRDAEYAITIDQRPFFRMSAVFDVVLLDPSTLQIRLPLAGIAIDGEDACSVNGQIATVIPLRTGRGVSVDLTSARPVPLPSSEADDTPNDSAQDHADNLANTLRIVIQCRLRSPKIANSQQVNVTIPELLSATALLKHTDFNAENIDTYRFGSQILDRDNHLTTAELGPVRTLKIDWPKGGTASKSKAFVPDLAMTSVIVHPLNLRLKSRLKFLTNTSSGGPVDTSIEFNLPSNAQVNDVQGLGLESWDVRHLGTEPVTIRLTFLSPLPNDSVVVEVAYLLPGVMSAGKITIPAFQFLPGQPTGDFPVHSLALTAAAGFHIEHHPALSPSNQVMRLPIDQFKQEWAEEEDLSPDLAYSLTTSQPLGITTMSISPERRAAINERMTIDGSTLQWQADVEFTSQAAAVALHRVDVDPNIQVTGVSVTQDGAERLIRWTRTSEQQLTLLLSNEMTGTQQVHLSGHLPFEEGHIMSLPHFSVPNAIVSQHSLTLLSRPDWTVESFDGHEQPMPLVESQAASNGEPVLQQERTFDRLSEVAPKSIRIEEAVSEFSFERVVIVDNVGENQWQVTTQLLLPKDEPLPQQIEMIMPREFAGTAGRTTSIPPAQQSTRSDGRLVLSLPTTTPDFVPRRIEITSTIPAHQNSAWRIPQIELPHGQSSEEWLILTSALPYDYEHPGESSVDSVQLSDRFLLPEEADGTPSRVFRSNRNDWTLSPRNLTGAGGLVSRLDTVIWKADSGQFSGVTSARISVRLLNELTIPLPPNLSVAQVEWKGGIVTTQSDGSAEVLVVPTGASTLEQDKSPLLTLWWTLPRDGIGMRHDIPILRPQEVPIITQNIAFFGSAQARYEVTDELFPLANDSAIGETNKTLPKLSPIALALQAAGYSTDPLTGADDTIFVGRFDDGNTQQSDVPLTIWELNRQLRRSLLVVLIAFLLLLVAWKTRLHLSLLHQLTNINRSLFAGPTLLAALLWASGPILLGFWLTLLCSIAWGFAIWKSHDSSTTFEYTATTSS